MTEVFSLFLKGFLIGIGMLIPGVSGGTVAVFLNVFEDILESVGIIFNDFKRSISTLLPIVLGGVLGLLVFSTPIGYIYARFPIITKGVFCILALISSFCFIRKKIGFSINIKQGIFVLSGCMFALIISTILKLYSINVSDGGFLAYFLIGIILSIALILPAISFSYMLLFFGIYETVVNAIGNYRFEILIPLCFGIIWGSYFFSKILLKLINSHTKETYCFVLGFVIMSIVDILQ